MGQRDRQMPSGYEVAPEGRDAILSRAFIANVAMDRLDEGVVAIDDQANLVYANAGAHALLGDQTRGNVADWVAIFDVLDPATHAPMAMEDWAPIRSLRGAKISECRCNLGRKGSLAPPRRIAVSSWPLLDDRGEIIGSVSIWRDLEGTTPTDEDDAARRADPTSLIAGGVAHDLNNLLGVVRNVAELIHQTERAGLAIRDGAHLLEVVARRGAELTSMLMALTNARRLQPVAIDMEALIDRAFAFVRPMLGPQTRLSHAVRPDLPPVLADPGQLLSAVINLVTNAMQAMPEGGWIRVRATRQTDLDAGDHGVVLKAGVYGRIEVHDDGHGIDAAFIDRIFEPFVTSRSAEGGTGLGLSSVREFVRRSGGEVIARNDGDKGARLLLWLPLASAEA